MTYVIGRFPDDLMWQWWAAACLPGPWDGQSITNCSSRKSWSKYSRCHPDIGLSGAGH